MAAAAMQPGGRGFAGGGLHPPAFSGNPSPPDASLDALCARFLAAPRANAWLLAGAPVAAATALAHASSPVERLASPAGATLVALGPDPASGLTLAALLLPGAEAVRAAMAPDDAGGAQLVAAVFAGEAGAPVGGRLIRFGALRSTSVGAGVSKSIDWFAAGVLPPAPVPASPLPPLLGASVPGSQPGVIPGAPTASAMGIPGVPAAPVVGIPGATTVPAVGMQGAPVVPAVGTPGTLATASGMPRPPAPLSSDEAARSAAMSRLSEVMSAPPPVTMAAGFVAPSAPFPLHTAPTASSKLGVLPAFHAPQLAQPGQSAPFPAQQAVPAQSASFPVHQTGLGAHTQDVAAIPTIPSLPGLPAVTGTSVPPERPLASFEAAEQLTELWGGMSETHSQSQIDAALALALAPEPTHAQPLPPALGAIPASAIFSAVPTTRPAAAPPPASMHGALSGGLPLAAPPTALSGGLPAALSGGMHPALFGRQTIARPPGASGGPRVPSPPSPPGAAPTVKKRSASTALVCHECGAVIRGKRGNLNRHIAARHLRTRAFSCAMPACGLAFQSRLNLERHMTRVHEGRAHRCLRCPRRFRTSGALARHAGAAHGPRRAFVCARCGAYFGRRSVLDAHALRVHPNDGAEATAGAPANAAGLACSLPGCAALFPTWPAKRDHETAAHAGRVHPCPTCERVLESEAALSRHLRTDHAATQTSRRCPVCGGVYSQRANLLRHISLAHKDFVWDGESGFPA